MRPPRASSAESSSPQTPEQIAAAIAEFLAAHGEAAVLEDGKVLFDLRTDRHTLSTEHGRCTLHLWSEERNMVRQVVSATPRSGTLRLATVRFGQAQPRLLELVSSRERRTPTSRESARQRYVKVLERVLQRVFAPMKPEGFRTAMDLERSFGPAYARGSLVQGNQAWAVIGVNEAENAPTIDGILTLGILWLQHCREQAGGKRLYQGLKLVLPRGTATLTLSRLAWMNSDAAQWELYELNQSTEELEQRDALDQGNLRTRLVHHPDEAAAAERFSDAVRQVMGLVPREEWPRVEQQLRGPAEMVFLLHGLPFARARVGFEANSFSKAIEITAGAGEYETPLIPATRESLMEHIAELFERRRAFVSSVDFGRRGSSPLRRIGSATKTDAAHRRMKIGSAPGEGRHNASQDPLYRAAPERWLESVLRADLAPLTRSLAAQGRNATQHLQAFANEPDQDSRGNRADAPEVEATSSENATRVIPRFDPRHVYTQVPAIAGASDRGLLDLLGVTQDGRLAVIELKADEDLHFALQGLDYWIRVRHHHLEGAGEFQRHGYFRGVELSPLPPRLYLVAPALRIHPATEAVLRYVSPRVEWHLLAIDERWRQEIRVVWRKSGGRA